ncbi:MAG TPA: hypothetical protein VMT42_01995 [candidate division Zixibacteria bacterium]|nr:hypothetical protein [candidate division Zixibacteria bacterium]
MTSPSHAHHPGGYGGNFPKPILAGCIEPLVAGAPDLRGIWQVTGVEEKGKPAPKTHQAYRHFERIEQCSDRMIVTGGGVIHDMRCDGTAEHGVNDVAQKDFKTKITVIAKYKKSALVGIATLMGSVVSGFRSFFLGFSTAFILAAALLGLSACLPHYWNILNQALTCRNSARLLSSRNLMGGSVLASYSSAKTFIKS